MLTESEFLNSFGNEGLKVEYKAAPNSIPHNLWETYSSFANTSGGTIILGVSEDLQTGKLSVTGVVNPEKSLKTFWDTLNNPSKVSTNILMDSDVKLWDVEGKTVIAIHVPAADRRDKPVYLNGNMLQHTYKRNHEGDYRCNRDEVHSMLRDSYDSDPDNLPLEGIDGYDCFDMDSVRSYMSMLGNRGHINGWTGGSMDEILQTIGALASDKNGLHPTRAGLLMFGRVNCILRSFPEFRLDYREESGEARWDYRLNSDQFGEDVNIMVFLKEVLGRITMKIGSRFGLDGVFREDDSGALATVREALVNCLVHADYQAPGGITVVYDGRSVRLSNPGGMRIPLEKAVRGGISDPRNRTLMRMFLSIGLVEEMGSGIRFMYKMKEKREVLDVSITESSNPLMINTTISLIPGNRSDSARDLEFMRYVSKNPNASIKEIAEHMGLSTKTVGQVAKDLQDKGQISREGNNRNTLWIVR